MNNLDPTIPPDLAQTVASELDTDEKVVWAAQPIPGKLAWKSLPIVLFGIPWTAFSVFWVWMAGVSKMNAGGVPASSMSSLFPLFGLPFILIGFGMLTSPYWAMRGARSTIYLITSRRAIIFQSKAFGGVRIRSFEPSKLGDMQRNQSADGSGDLILAEDWSTFSDNQRTSIKVGFLGIANVKEPETHIRELVAGVQK